MSVIPLHGRLGALGDVYRPHAQLGRAAGKRRDDPQRVCTGKLRWSDVRGPVPMVECDECGFETGVLR
jgi:hypothetical protein